METRDANAAAVFLSSRGTINDLHFVLNVGAPTWLTIRRILHNHRNHLIPHHHLWQQAVVLRFHPMLHIHPTPRIRHTLLIRSVRVVAARSVGSHQHLQANNREL